MCDSDIKFSKQPNRDRDRNGNDELNSCKHDEKKECRRHVEQDPSFEEMFFSMIFYLLCGCKKFAEQRNICRKINLKIQ